MSKTFSGKEIISILFKKYDFREISISGSHMKMRKIDGNKTITTIVPLHKEVLIGTFHHILRLARIDPKDFIEKSNS
ncbi:MAG TPA: type II toxin-antitoxin system HicA family toxin [Candidatus Paceibacterota bacterium]